MWSNLFKYSLQLELYELAYDAMINNPDIERYLNLCVDNFIIMCSDQSNFRRRECLKHFVVVLTEQQQLRELCNYNYVGMEEEVI